ncbi:MAG TPA: hypothetical protein VIK78_14400 [Ruminiclostridium sp.]
MGINLILLVLALICWFLATINVPSKISLGWLGMFCYGLSLILK